VTDRPTFSQSWSRVSRLTPTLRPHVQIHRQLYRGEPWHIVHDPVSNNFFRLNPVAYHLVGLLDGRRTVDDVWRLTLDRFGDDAPTQNEVIGLLGQLNQSNLLRVDLPADAEQLLKRNRQRRIKHWTGQAMSILFLRIPLFNPDKFLEWMLPLFKPLLNRWTMVAWFVWIGFCLSQFLPHLREFMRSSTDVLAPANWGWMIVLFIVTKAWHEFGHGITCKRLGGAVPEFGIMMLVLFPAPFVDATSSWAFPDKWKRLLVAAAGMIFELALAGVAALVWVNSDEGVVRQLAYNTVFLASVTTILFNANPLLRFDGYYMLSDLIEVPNLYDRSKKHLFWLVQRFAYGVRQAQAVATSRFEQGILTVYGIGASIYKVVVMLGIILFISNQLWTLGLVLAAWSLFAWLAFPLGKLVHWLATASLLHEHRPRAVAVTVLFAALVLGITGLVPVDDHRRAQGVIESSTSAEIAVQTDGFVDDVKVTNGQRVEKDQVLWVAGNPDLTASERELSAQIKSLELARRQGLGTDIVEMKMNEAKLEALRKEHDEIAQRLDKLTVRAPVEGILVSSGFLEQLEGQFLKRGQVVAKVVDPSKLRVTALIDQAHNAAPFFTQIQKVEVRTAGDIKRVVESKRMTFFNSGRNDLPHPALGYHGGGIIPTDQRDPHGQKSLTPQFEVWLDLPLHQMATQIHGQLPAFPGQRVYVRFTLPPRPLAVQWIHALRQMFRDRFAI
jgi:putative peptide zinc metalloprotease protein